MVLGVLGIGLILVVGVVGTVGVILFCVGFMAAVIETVTGFSILEEKWVRS